MMPVLIEGIKTHTYDTRLDDEHLSIRAPAPLLVCTCLLVMHKAQKITPY